MAWVEAEAPASSSRTGAAPQLTTRLLVTLTATTAFTVGNIYYGQPLLPQIAASFGQSPAAVGASPMLCQLGYVVGLLFLTPLGDVLEKRRLLVTLLVLAGVALSMAGLAPTFHLFLAACVGIGLTTPLAQVLIPFVAVLSAKEDRGRNLGVVVGAALIGVLASRTLSGFVAEHLGWRTVYFGAAGIMLLLALLLRLELPQHRASTRLTYPRLLVSLWELVRDLPDLRGIAITGALMFAALSVFWASLAFYLGDHFHTGPNTAGLFGLVGTVGALAATLAGRNAQRIGARRLVLGCIVVMLLAYVVFALLGASWLGLVAGVVLLDLGAQAGTVSNQTEMYALHPDAQTRLNTIYKMVYFAGGAAGSWSSAIAWGHHGWRGVCAVGAAFLVLAFGWMTLDHRRRLRGAKAPCPDQGESSPSGPASIPPAPPGG